MKIFGDNKKLYWKKVLFFFLVHTESLFTVAAAENTLIGNNNIIIIVWLSAGGRLLLDRDLRSRDILSRADLNWNVAAEFSNEFLLLIKKKKTLTFIIRRLEARNLYSLVK